MKKHIYVLLFSILFCRASYSFIPVIDVESIAEEVVEIGELTEQINLAKEQLDNAKNQLSEMKEQIDDMTGIYGWGDLLDSAKDLRDREFTPESWQDALKGLSGGNNDRYEALLNAYKKSHPVVSDDVHEMRNTKAQTDQFDDSVNTVNAVATTAQMTYEKLDDYLKETHELTQKIESNKNEDIKSSMDLNARLSANNANLLAALIRVQTVQANLEAEEAQQRIQGESQQAEFMKLEKKDKS